MLYFFLLLSSLSSSLLRFLSPSFFYDVCLWTGRQPIPPNCDTIQTTTPSGIGFVAWSERICSPLISQQYYIFLITKHFFEILRTFPCFILNLLDHYFRFLTLTFCSSLWTHYYWTLIPTYFLILLSISFHNSRVFLSLNSQMFSFPFSFSDPNLIRLLFSSRWLHVPFTLHPLSFTPPCFSSSPTQAYSILLLHLFFTPSFCHSILFSPILFSSLFSIPSTFVSFLLHFIFPPPLLKLSPPVHHLLKFRLLLPPSPQVSSNLVLLSLSLSHLSSAHPLSCLLLRDQMDVN